MIGVNVRDVMARFEVGHLGMVARPARRSRTASAGVDLTREDLRACLAFADRERRLVVVAK